MDNDVKSLVEGMLKTKILEAFSGEAELVEKLIKTAIIDHKVDSNGSVPRFGGGMPYLDYLIGQQIRNAAAQAVRESISDRMSDLKQQIQNRLTNGEFADAATSAMLDKLSDDWRVQVQFTRTDED